MYSKFPNLILGFHGTDEEIVMDVVAGKTELNKSKNDYDWLGNGIYFWEFNYNRALDFAIQNKGKKKDGKVRIKKPSVIGAVIDLGLCLNLVDNVSLMLLKDAYNLFVTIQQKNNLPLPQNIPLGENNDLLKRNLDCAVIETLHSINDEIQFDSVRGVFFEGNDLYPNAGFKEKNHIQICIRNPNCIKGYFLPRRKDINFRLP